MNGDTSTALAPIVERPGEPVAHGDGHPTAWLAPQAPRFSFGEIEAMANYVAKSGLFPGINNPQQAVTLMMLCDAEGLHPMIALKRYHIIEGRPSMRADAMQAEFQMAGGRIAWGYSDADVCEAVFYHPVQAPEGVPIRVTFAELNQAGVTKGKEGLKKNWRQFPRQMLRARCVSEGVRMVLPGVVAGIYTPEELSDFDPPPASIRPPARAETPRRSPPQPEPEPGPVGDTPARRDDFGVMVGRALDRWEVIEPTEGGDHEGIREARYGRLVNRVITEAIDAGKLASIEVAKPTGKRDREKAKAKLRELYATERAWVLDAVAAYLEEKAAGEDDAEPTLAETTAAEEARREREAIQGEAIEEALAN